MIVDKILLWPYFLALKNRHRRYDEGKKPVHTSDTASICIGNVTVGGTGKTPFAEMTLEILKDRKAALLSRGYKGKTKGYVEVLTTSNARETGDEPLQIKRKFPDIKVAVCRKRETGVDTLTEEGAELVVLDDAFQYRGFKATKSVVLIDYSRPVHKDHLLPLGSLRDLPERIANADLVVVTKCPTKGLDYQEKIDWVKEEREKWSENLALLGYRKQILFADIEYDRPQCVFEGGEQRYSYASSAVTLSAIAGNKAFINAVSETKKVEASLKFRDHHAFTRRDCKKINKIAARHPLSAIITTEKDAVRLIDCKQWLSDDVKRRTLAWRIKTRFTTEEDYITYTNFIKSIL